MGTKDLLFIQLDMTPIYIMPKEFFKWWLLKHAIEGMGKNEEITDYNINVNLDRCLHDITSGYGFLNKALLLLSGISKLHGFNNSYINLDGNITLKDLRSRVEKTDPSIVAISPITPQMPQLRLVSSIIKDYNPHCKIIVGGHHVSALDIKTMEEYKNIDIIVRGEGELTFEETINKLKNEQSLASIKGITYRKGKRIIRNSNRSLIDNLGCIPLPDLSMIPTDSNWIYLFSFSRGCPYQCSFCSDSFFWGNCVRFFPLDWVEKELTMVKNRFPKIRFMNIDSNFLLPLKGIEKRVNLLNKKNIQLFNLLVRANHISTKSLETLESLHFKSIYLGVENFNNNILNKMNKNISSEKLIQSLLKINKIIPDKQLTITWINGYPGETVDIVNRNIKIIGELLRKKIIDDVDPCFFVPHPGTPVFNYPNKYGLTIHTYDWGKYNYHLKPVYYTNQMTAFKIWKQNVDFYRKVCFLMAERKNFNESLNKKFFNETFQATNHLHETLVQKITKKGWNYINNE